MGRIEKTLERTERITGLSLLIEKSPFRFKPNCFSASNSVVILFLWKQFTSAQVAEMLGYSRSMVLLVCQRKNLPRFGNQYVLGEDEIDKNKKSLGYKPMVRPRKEDR